MIHLVWTDQSASHYTRKIKWNTAEKKGKKHNPTYNSLINNSALFEWAKGTEGNVRKS